MCTTQRIDGGSPPGIRIVHGPGRARLNPSLPTKDIMLTSLTYLGND